MSVKTVPRLQLEGISRTFSLADGRQRAVLDDISLTVNPGEFVSIIGPSGCGQSTLFNIIAANAALGLEVQGVKRRAARARVKEWFPRFGLEGFEDSLPFELSGGMRQRAALLRTVVQNKSTLLLDEPFGALDALTKQDLQTWLQQVWAEHNWTALLITHDVREAILLSDRVVVLSPRPASVSLILDVDLPKPRGIDALTSPRFLELERTLLQTLGS